jgi:hypothetical protein
LPADPDYTPDSNCLNRRSKGTLYDQAQEAQDYPRSRISVLHHKSRPSDSFGAQVQSSKMYVSRVSCIAHAHAFSFIFPLILLHTSWRVQLYYTTSLFLWRANTPLPDPVARRRTAVIQNPGREQAMTTNQLHPRLSWLHQSSSVHAQTRPLKTSR